MRKICLGFLIFFSGFSYAKPLKKLLPQLKSSLDKIVKDSGIKKKNLSIYISSGDNGENLEVYSLNSNKKRIPASLTKIVTAGTALSEFPIGHKFTTELRADPDMIKGESLESDLYLVGDGDPGFVSESMWQLVNEFKRSGIEMIEGDIIVDDNKFDSVRFDPGREPSRVDRAYDAPIGAMTFNWSSVNVYIRPGLKKGDPAKVVADPESEYIQVVNRAKTGAKSSGQSIRVSREKGRADGSFGDTIIVTGKIAQGYKEIVKYKSITRPDYWAGYNLRAFLQRRGIGVKGEVKTGSVPSKAKVLADLESKPMRELVSDMMKYSNNYVAEILTKNLGALKDNRPASMESGMKVLKKFLKNHGLKEKNFQMTNPSGLSRKNYFRAIDLHKILIEMKKTFRVFPEAIVSMPIGGVDGTLRKWMDGSPAEGRVRAKTGHLRGVSGLAGYVGSRSGRSFTFAFIYNGKQKRVTRARRLYTKLASFLSDVK